MKNIKNVVLALTFSLALVSTIGLDSDPRPPQPGGVQEAQDPRPPQPGG